MTLTLHQERMKVWEAQLCEKLAESSKAKFIVLEFGRPHIPTDFNQPPIRFRLEVDWVTGKAHIHYDSRIYGMVDTEIWLRSKDDLVVLTVAVMGEIDRWTQAREEIGSRHHVDVNEGLIFEITKESRV